MAALAAACPGPASASPPQHGEEELIRAYLAGEPERLRAVAARANSQAAGLTDPYLPHPELSLNREQSFGDTAAAATVAGLSISLEIGGRHGLKKEAAGKEAKAARLAGEAQRREAICGLRHQVRQAHAGQRAVTLLTAGQRRLEATATDLKRLVKAGERAPYDLQRLHLQLEAHGHDLSTRRSQLAATLAGLSAVTGLEVRQVKLASNDGVKAALTGTAKPAAERALEASARAAEAKAEAAGRRWIPDLGLYGAYRLEQAPGLDAGHGYEAGLTLNLPFTDAGRVDTAAAGARRQELRAAARMMKARRRASLRALEARAAELRKARDRRDLDLKQLATAAARRYLTGVSSLEALLDTLEALEQAALNRAAVRAELDDIALAAACARGSFDEPAIERMVQETTP